MSLAKVAQMDMDGFSLPVGAVDSGSIDDLYLEDLPEIEGHGEVAIQLDDEEPIHKEFDFTLPAVPGGKDQDDIPALEVSNDEEVEVEDDPWKWSHTNFLEWLEKMMKNVPKHSGKDVSGIERAIGFLEDVAGECPKAVRTDKNAVIDVEAVERAREEIYNGLERLHDRLDKIMENKYPKRNKNKKKADAQEEGLVKEANKSTKITGITITVPLLISSIVRTCINSMVSAGKDIEDCFEKLAKKYDLTDREVFEAVQLFSDMGYAIRRPRGYNLDEKIDYTSTDNFDYMANYPG